MRTLFAITVFAIACGGTSPKTESALVPEADTPPTCCCKTLPTTAEKELVPNYAVIGRMECSGAGGDCVDEVQCNAVEGDGQQALPADDGVPPPPMLEPSTDAIGAE